MTDWHTSELFGIAARALGQSIEFPVSRLLVDPERFPNDADECMSKIGMGALYNRTSHGVKLRHEGCDQGSRRTQLMDQFYIPHHRRLLDLTDAMLSEHRKAYIVDCHSFPSAPLPYEADQGINRPDICLGTDAFHTPAALVDELTQELEERGYRVSLNRPFAGALTPLKHYQKTKHVSSIMIEVNRSIYMDEETTVRTENFSTVANDLLSVLRTALI